MWNSQTTQNLNIYLHNYQKETAIFLATKHEKTIMTCSYLIFSSHTENTSKKQKMVAFVRNCLWKWLWGCFSQFLLLWIYYSANASDAVQKQRLAQAKDTAGVMQIKSEFKSNIYFFLQVYFGPINSTLYLHVKKLTIACNTCVERILLRLNLV